MHKHPGQLEKCITREHSCTCSLTRFLNSNRALLMLVMLFAGLSLFAPNFFTTHNVTTILKGASLNAIVAIGFTVIFIFGQLDLSIGAAIPLQTCQPGGFGVAANDEKCTAQGGLIQKECKCKN